MSVEVRPMRADEFGAWLPKAKEGYAAGMIESGGYEPAAAREKAEQDFATLLADGVATDVQWLYTVEEDGEPVGVLWLAERDADGGRTVFVYDVQVDEARRGRGLGRAAMQFAEEEARRRGIPRVSLNVFGGNKVARGLYRSLGYAEVAVWMVKAV